MTTKETIGLGRLARCRPDAAPTYFPNCNVVLHQNGAAMSVTAHRHPFPLPPTFSISRHPSYPLPCCFVAPSCFSHTAFHVLLPLVCFALLCFALLLLLLK
jgi:hypothetical protein